MLFFAFLFFLLFFPSFTNALIITEVQIEGESVDDCYIKIYNPLKEDIDISGYNIRKKSSTGRDSSVRVIPSENKIKGQDYFTWASSRNKNFPSLIGADIYSTQYLSKDNSIAIFNDQGELLDALSWGEGEDPYVLGNSIENPKKGQIIKRKEEEGVYKTKGDNFSDFYLYPSSTSSFKIKNIEKEKTQKEEINVFLISSVLSFLLASIIIYLKKKWQGTVTQKI